MASEIAGALSNAEKARQLRNNDMTAMPARKPVITGVNRRFATQPSLRIPPASSITPTSKASVVAADPIVVELPVARAASVPANIGVMVESAPAVRTRLAPRAAKPIVAAMKA